MYTISRQVKDKRTNNQWPVDKINQLERQPIDPPQEPGRRRTLLAKISSTERQKIANEKNEYDAAIRDREGEIQWIRQRIQAYEKSE